MKIGLCAGRHPVPVENYIFDSIEDITDLQGMAKVASQKLKSYKEVELYVTGLSVALVTVINVCFDLGIRLTLLHYNAVTGEYFSQGTPHKNDVNLF